MDSEEKTVPMVSLVVPFRDAAQTLDAFLADLKAQAQGLAEPYEIIFVDDGSADGAAGRLETIAQADASVKVVVLSGPFGFESSVLAGLNHAGGQAVVWLPVEGSHVLGSIKAMLAKYREGFDIVSLDRSADNNRAKASKCPFKCLIHGDSEDSACDAMLVSQAVARAMCDNADRFTSLAELIKWIGFTRGQVESTAGPADKSGSRAYSAAGQSAACPDPHGLVRKTCLAGEMLTAAGVLYMIVHAGACIFNFCLPGWAFALSAVAVFFGIQCIFMSVVLFRLCQLAPAKAAGLGYVVRKTAGFAHQQAAGQADSDDDDDIKPFMLWT
ncbi:MAG: glycosyltransferase [Planctomycetes bacterium]|nr:glycosyltransferase [Planctomycetota bacterium]